jgi:hypothetical protein
MFEISPEFRNSVLPKAKVFGFVTKGAIRKNPGQQQCRPPSRRHQRDGAAGNGLKFQGHPKHSKSRRHQILGWSGAGALIGFAWALWHLPLLYMADTAQADLPIALFLTSTVGLSVAMARLGVHVGFSVLPALLLHSVINW